MNPDPLLKPLFGLPPKYWLAGTYLVAFLAVLFFLLLAPGLWNPGTLLTVKSVPEGAGVSWDNVPLGQTPLTVFLPEGKGDLRVSKSAFVPSKQRLNLGSSVVFSLFWPKTGLVEVSLQPRSSQSVAAEAVVRVGRWSLAAPFNDSSPFPPLFSELARDERAVGMAPEALRSLLLQLRPLVADPQMYADYGRSLGLWDSAPPPGLGPQVALWTPLLSVAGTETTRLVFWVLANQGPAERKEVLDQGGAEFQALRESWQKSILTLPDGVGIPPPKVVAAGVTFTGVATQWYYWGQTSTKATIPTELPYRLPVPVKIEAFWLAAAPVTQGEFAAFLVQSPEWGPDNAVRLGRADDGYLRGWSGVPPPQPADPVTGVSWLAAQAYVAWLNIAGRAPSGHEFSLASEQEWEAAVRQSPALLDAKVGNWEWTASPYGSADPLVWGQNPVPELPYPSYARTLKGGSAVWLRAGAPAESTSPVVGFRLALRAKSEVRP